MIRASFAVIIGVVGALSAGCQAGYLIRAATSHVSLLNKRVPLDEALADSKLTDDQKRKLRLAREAREFGETTLGLKKTRNYESFVQLERPYVSYVVHAAPKYELKPYLWSFPFVGSVPYKGYPDPESAKEEADRLRERGYDVYVRGVSAYSTLGWFRDPILSSMLRYEDWDLVNTIIHESTHATLFIGSETNFNERLASFVGNKGTELFYSKREGADSPSLASIRAENAEEKLFSAFISRELIAIDKWYESRKAEIIPEDERLARLKEIQTRFAAEVRPHLAPNRYRGFETTELNNARLLTYRLYVEDLSDFERAFGALGGDMVRFVEFCKSLEDAKDPVTALKAAGVVSR